MARNKMSSDNVRKVTHHETDELFLKEGHLKARVLERRKWYRKILCPKIRFNDRWLRAYVIGSKGLRLEFYNHDPRKVDYSKRKPPRTVLMTNVSSLKRTIKHDFGLELCTTDIAEKREPKPGARSPSEPQPYVQLLGTSHSEIEGWADKFRDVMTPSPENIDRRTRDFETIITASIVDTAESVELKLSGRVLIEFNQNSVTLNDPPTGEIRRKIELAQICSFDLSDEASEVVDQGRLFRLRFRDTDAPQFAAPLSLLVFTREGERLSGLIMRLMNPLNPGFIHVERRQDRHTTGNEEQRNSANRNSTLSQLQSILRRSLPSLFDSTTASARNSRFQKQQSSNSDESSRAATNVSLNSVAALPSVNHLQATEASRAYERQLLRKGLQSEPQPSSRAPSSTASLPRKHHNTVVRTTQPSSSAHYSTPSGDSPIADYALPCDMSVHEPISAKQIDYMNLSEMREDKDADGNPKKPIRRRLSLRPPPPPPASVSTRKPAVEVPAAESHYQNPTDFDDGNPPNNKDQQANSDYQMPAEWQTEHDKQHFSYASSTFSDKL